MAHSMNVGRMEYEQWSFLAFNNLLIEMTLYVKPISALLTRDTEMFSNMDPYVVLSIGGDKKKTKTHKQGGKKPKWDEVLIFKPSNTFMEVTVYDEDTFTDDTVGSTKIDLAKYISSQTEEKQYFSLTYKGKSAGKLYMSIRYQREGSSGWGGSNNKKSDWNTPSNNGSFSNTQNSWGNGQKKQSGWQSQQPIGWGNNQSSDSGWSNQPRPNTGYGTHNQNSGWGNTQNQSNSGWGNQNNTAQQNDGWGKQNNGWGKKNDGWGPQNNGWGPQNNGWGGNQGNQGNQNSGWGNQGNQNDGWGNNQGNQNNGWGNQQNQPSEESQQALKALGAMFGQQNQVQGGQQQGNENVMGILSGALQQGVQNAPQNPGNSGGWQTGANSGWGPNNNGWGSSGNKSGW